MTSTTQQEIRCQQCGDTDGPFAQDYIGDWFCEHCLPKLTGGPQ